MIQGVTQDNRQQFSGRWKVRHSTFQWAICLISWGTFCQSACGQPFSENEPVHVENLWPADVTIEVPDPVKVIEPAFVQMFLEALEHDEADLRQEVVSFLERIHREGVDQSLLSKEMNSLLSLDNQTSVNLAIASFLIAIDDKSSADSLFGLLKAGHVEFSQIVEPALASWSYAPIQEVWRKRLIEPSVRRTHLRLAIEGLGATKDQSAIPALLKYVTDRNESASTRILAAKSIGAITENETIRNVAKLLVQGQKFTSTDRLCGIYLLSGDTSEEAIGLLQPLLLENDGAVAGAAWRRLLDLDSALTNAHAEKCVSSRDPFVRQCVIQTFREHPTLIRVNALGDLMGDPHPDVRVKARFALRQLAEEEKKLDVRIREIGMQTIENSDASPWSLEQALILLTVLDEKNAAGPTVELLNHEHPKVFVTAAWSLRILNVEKTYRPMLNHASKVSNGLLRLSRNDDNVLPIDQMDQLAHLFDAFGNAGYVKAEELMRKFVPKNAQLSGNCRAAAITSLGKFYHGQSDNDLVPVLIRRMNDQDSEPGEAAEVWSTSAIALGRMKAKSALEDLRQYYYGEPPVSGLSFAAAWSIRELTGEEIADPVAAEIPIRGFTLEPTIKRFQFSADKVSSDGGE